MMEGYPCQRMDDVGVTMIHSHCAIIESSSCTAEIAQLGERQTEDLKVPGSIPGLGNFKKLTKWDMLYVPHMWSTKKPCNCPSVTVHRWRLLPYFENWRIRVSIPVPLECKSSALPLELIPLVLRTFWKPRHCMNDMWTSIISNSSFTTPDVDGNGWIICFPQTRAYLFFEIATTDSSVGRAGDCRSHTKSDISRSLVQIRLGGHDFEHTIW